jgi:acyl-CoA thioesterase-1
MRYSRRVKLRRVLGFLVSPLLLTSACDKCGDGGLGPAPPPPPVSTSTGGADPATGEIRLLALGDSVTQGLGTKDPSTSSFPVLLAAKWRSAGCKVEVKNPAVTRYVASDVIEKELPLIATFKPTLITFQIGANDVANNVPIETYRTNVQKILEAGLKSGARVLVFPQNEWFRSPQGPNYGKNLPTRRAEFDKVLIDETKAKGAELVDLRNLYRQQADKKMWSDDDIHPTAEAYVAWADEIARVIPPPCKK